MHTYTKDNIIMDIVNNKKVLFVLEEKTRPQALCNKLSLLKNISNPSVHSILTEEQHAINFGPVEKRTCLNIFTEDEFEINPKNYFLESIHTRLRQQEYFDISKNQAYDKMDTTKEIRRDFYGDKGGVYIEFKTQHPDDFRFILYSSSRKRVVLDILKIITSKPFVMVLPLFDPDILTLRLYPKYKRNNYLEMKIVNLPVSFSKESLIDCNIGLGKNQKFIFPTIGSSNFIIFWEKERGDDILGTVESGDTHVPIEGNGNFRTDNAKYSIIYKNNGKKKRNIKIFMGSTRK